MKQALIYIHGQGGCACEAEHYSQLFPGCEVIGFDYRSGSLLEAETEFGAYFDIISEEYDAISIIANSIGAFFAMNSLSGRKIRHAYFISPIVDMEQLICNMMAQSGITEDELRKHQEITVQSGETLSWEYLSYVREHHPEWEVPTHILYGENDEITSFRTITEFSKKTGATLDVMPGGEHWFHTPEQFAFLDDWIRKTNSSL